MFAIEVDGIRYEADTEAEAKKLLRRAAREAKKEQTAKEGRRAVARLKAESRAYRILCCKAELDRKDETSFPRAWVMYQPGDKWAHNLFTPGTEPYSTALHTEDGTLVIEHWGNNLLGAICNGSGFCWLVFLQDRDRPQEILCAAVAVHEGEYVLAQCPGITPELFRRPTEERSPGEAAA